MERIRESEPARLVARTVTGHNRRIHDKSACRKDWANPEFRVAKFVVHRLMPILEEDKQLMATQKASGTKVANGSTPIGVLPKSAAISSLEDASDDAAGDEDAEATPVTRSKHRRVTPPMRLWLAVRTREPDHGWPTAILMKECEAAFPDWFESLPGRGRPSIAEFQSLVSRSGAEFHPTIPREQAISYNKKPLEPEKPAAPPQREDVPEDVPDDGIKYSVEDAKAVTSVIASQLDLMERRALVPELESLSLWLAMQIRKSRLKAVVAG